jgi:tetratricopeptide (TPR) repeat protein
MRQQKSERRAIWTMKLSGCLLIAALFAGCNNPAVAVSPKEAIQKYEADYRAAVELHQKLIREGRDVDALHFELGMLYFGRAEYKLSLEEFKNSNSVQAAKMSAIVYYNLGDYVEALKILDEQKYPDDQALYYYGLTCEKLNLFDKALQNYRKIKPGEFKTLASIREELIEKAGAVKHIQELDPEIAKMISGAPSADKYPQAGAQILLCDEKVQVTADNKEISSLHYLVKILNERGKEGFSETQIGYDSTYEKVELEFARTIKPDGTVMDVGSRHTRDVSKYMNFPLYSNARVFIISFPEIAEGAAVEYKVKILRNQLVNKKILSWIIRSSPPSRSSGLILPWRSPGISPYS